MLDVGPVQSRNGYRFFIYEINAFIFMFNILKFNCALDATHLPLYLTPWHWYIYSWRTRGGASIIFSSSSLSMLTSSSKNGGVEVVRDKLFFYLALWEGG
ncbi:hypothetical protein V6N13_036712 [Hibiscus sabdariffa]